MTIYTVWVDNTMGEDYIGAFTARETAQWVKDELHKYHGEEWPICICEQKMDDLTKFFEHTKGLPRYHS